MIYRIVCPVQDPDAFKIENCLTCRYFTMSKGVHINVGCRKNRKPKHRRDFEGAYLSNYLRLPDIVVIEGTEEG